jgi:hypothetical protein
MLVYYNKGKISDIIHGNPNDECEQLEKSGIYEIKCDGCNAVYIVQTGRYVAVRFGKNFRHIRYNHPKLSAVMSSNNSQHKISIDKVSFIKEMRKPNQLDAYEGICIIIRKQKKKLNL